MSEAQVKRSVHIIPLSRVYFGRRMNRADRAVRLVKKYVARHYKQAEKIVIDPLVNKLIWSRGREKPPRRVVVEIRYNPEEKTAKVLLARSTRKTKNA
ncbi:50S ribosomal protein L31e [Thermogladius calderae 1633]|uniref:Large ribosomal subunit protein eL31 n=1 Tax=Thermogladius calderae (strain DSM 22663 / VKM B-2946 / 1633) TaxID=1184251 RepID=I3TDG6_THEC1|nr:50S ribosomal protein L31e [Thermogladius calderae]AFK50804.1 50S ribosomal protein L31e [Thermogladius calderae 1633]